MSEIKRTKTKLALMDQDGCVPLLVDAMKLANSYSSGMKQPDEFYISNIEEMKQAYKQFLADNEKDLLIQGKLEL